MGWLTSKRTTFMLFILSVAGGVCKCSVCDSDTQGKGDWKALLLKRVTVARAPDKFIIFDDDDDDDDECTLAGNKTTKRWLCGSGSPAHQWKYLQLHQQGAIQIISGHLNFQPEKAPLFFIPLRMTRAENHQACIISSASVPSCIKTMFIEHHCHMWLQAYKMQNTNILARKFREMKWLIREVTEIDLCLSSVNWEYRFSQTGCGNLLSIPWRKERRSLSPLYRTALLLWVTSALLLSVLSFCHFAPKKCCLAFYLP